MFRLIAIRSQVSYAKNLGYILFGIFVIMLLVSTGPTDIPEESDVPLLRPFNPSLVHGYP